MPLNLRWTKSFSTWMHTPAIRLRRCPLVERYQAEIGPLTPLGNMSHTKWEWVSRPFPWDYDANV